MPAPIEHPEPTQATAKLLYANAFRCARPGCRRPLYSVDGETGIRTLNSRIAHIHARREGGPRFDLNQSADDNRHANNLLVLCLEHANEVDVPGWETRFPPSVLKEWKEAQLRDFDRIQQGWAIPDEDLTKVFVGPSFAGDVTLGGAGGAAPGAGGGGGGAIGDGRGGAGGAGGATYNLNGTPGIAPGAGGGGGGARGEGAAGGDGGPGGARVVATFRIEDLPDQLEIMVGAGGLGGEVGKPGAPGEPSFIRYKLPNGTCRELVRADGGGVAAAIQPTDARDPTQATPVLTLMLADYADVRDGLLFVAGGGWITWTAPTLPASLSVTAVVTLGAPATNVRLLCHRPSHGDAVGAAHLESLPARSPWRIRWSLMVDAPGRWTFALFSEETCLGVLPLDVIVRESQANR